LFEKWERGETMGTLYKGAVRIIVLVVFLSIESGLVFGQDPLINGVIFSDYTYVLDNAQNSFNVRRAYLNFRGGLSDNLSYRITSDASAADSGYELFLKYAFLDWRPHHFTELRLQFGMLPTNTFQVQKRTWGLRYLYKTIFNQYRVVSSADIGIRADKIFNQNTMVSALISNGEGYKNAESDKYKQFHLLGVFGNPDLLVREGINVGGYFSYEPLSSESRSLIYHCFAGIHEKRLWAGGEIGQHVLTNPDVNTTYLSVYTRYQSAARSQIFFRTDFASNSEWNESTIITGLQYQPLENLKIAPNIIYIINSDSENSVILRANVELRF
jgi:hypothetical protein